MSDDNLPTYDGAAILSEDVEPDGLSLFAMSAGAYSSTEALVFARSLEKAFELFVEYLDDHAPGHLTTLDEGDLGRAAEDLGVTWPTDDEDIVCRVQEAAEADLTVIGHTTLRNGTHIPSWEWGAVEVSQPDTLQAVRAAYDRGQS